MPHTVVTIDGKTVIDMDVKPGGYVISNGVTFAAGEDRRMVTTADGLIDEEQAFPEQGLSNRRTTNESFAGSGNRFHHRFQWWDLSIH